MRTILKDNWNTIEITSLLFEYDTDDRRTIFFSFKVLESYNQLDQTEFQDMYIDIPINSTYDQIMKELLNKALRIMEDHEYDY
jgi:hypothetical protein